MIDKQTPLRKHIRRIHSLYSKKLKDLEKKNDEGVELFIINIGKVSRNSCKVKKNQS